MSRKTNSQGFTLIELLVVISIIGLISTIVLSALSVARSKARDTERVQEMMQLRNALQLYHATIGIYPASGFVYNAPITPTSTLTTNLTNILTPTHIPSIPTPPGSTFYGYVSGAVNLSTCNNVSVTNLPFALIFSTENSQTGRLPAWSPAVGVTYPTGSASTFVYCLTLN